MSDKVLTTERCELKYYVSLADAVTLRKRLSAVLCHDSYSEKAPYRVKSLYFDSLTDGDYYSKTEGNNIRKKIRLRIYDEAMDRAKLEWKAKEGQFQHKHSLWIKREDAKRMSAGDYTCLTAYGSSEALRFYSAMTLECYRPVVMIEYMREAFVHPLYKTRITIDSNIRSSETETDIFKRDIPMIPVLDSLAVLEVKYNGKLPEYISKVISSVPHVNSSVSKYCGSRNIIVDCM